LNHYRYSIETYRAANLNEKVIPIFIFDFTHYDLLLIDNEHQAVSFPDMIIAVQIKGEGAEFDFTSTWCDSYPIHVDRRVATRPVLASLLQTLFGISATHRVWNPTRGGYSQDLIFTTGNTPFGHFSNATQLTFPQRDGAVRNFLLEMVNNTMGDLLHELSRFDVFGKVGT
jgi:hypothetical protein